MKLWHYLSFNFASIPLGKLSNYCRWVKMSRNLLPSGRLFIKNKNQLGKEFKKGKFELNLCSGLRLDLGKCSNFLTHPELVFIACKLSISSRDHKMWGVLSHPVENRFKLSWFKLIYNSKTELLVFCLFWLVGLFSLKLTFWSLLKAKGHQNRLGLVFWFGFFWLLVCVTALKKWDELRYIPIYLVTQTFSWSSGFG